MELFLFLFLLIKQVYGGSMYLNTTVPQRENPVRLSCSSTTATSFYLYNKNIDQYALTSCTVSACSDQDYGRNGQVFYRFGTSSGQAYVDILSLNRTRDQTVWSCLYQNDQPSQFNLTVFSIPQELYITQEGDMNTDLSMSSTSIECKTIGCTYPAPIIQWLYRDQSASTGYEVFRNVAPTVMAGSCVRPEEVYISRLNLSRMTTLNDNSDRTVMFSCRIEYPDPSLNIIATGTKTVTFAVSVTSAVIQQNKMNITNTLSVTSDEASTLTCITGASRPSPIINWYIGSEWKSTGTSLIFIPRAMDHDMFIYCLAYNTDPNLNVSSNKAMLYVRVTPEKPFNFHPTNVQEKQLSLRWQAGYNGGYTQTFMVEISLDNTTWNNVSQVSAGNRDGWFTTVIGDLIPGSEYYLRLYAYNINGRGDFADVQLAIRTFKDVCASAGISVGGAVGAGVGGAVGGIVLGLIGAIIAFTIRRQLNGSKCSCFRSKRKTDDAMHTYSNTEMNPQTVKPIYEDLNKGNTEPSVYDKISTL